MEAEPLLERLPLRQQIYQVLRERIVTGQIAPGETVRDAQVAQAMGASRTPVREALVRLTSEGLLENLVGRGFRATPLSRRELEEVHPLLTTLEPMALASSAPLQARQLKKLERLAQRMQASGGDPIALHSLDSQWHQTLIEGCANSRLLRYVEELRDSLRRYELAHLNHAEDMQLSVDEHRAIAAAEERQARGAAVELLSTHWLRGRAELLARIPEDEA